MSSTQVSFKKLSVLEQARCRFEATLEGQKKEEEGRSFKNQDYLRKSSDLSRLKHLKQTEEKIRL